MNTERNRCYLAACAIYRDEAPYLRGSGSSSIV